MTEEKYTNIMRHFANAVTIGGSLIAEYSVMKIAGCIIDAVLPSNFKAFPKLIIKVGASIVYEATIGEKVAEYFNKSVWNGIQIGAKVANDADLFDDAKPEESETEPKEAGA